MVMNRLVGNGSSREWRWDAFPPHDSVAYVSTVAAAHATALQFYLFAGALTLLLILYLVTQSECGSPSRFGTAEQH